MQIKIAIVENETQSCFDLQTQLKKWASTANHSILISAFASGEAFLQQNVFSYDVVFLDIELENINGIEIARYLRANDYSSDIVFLTSHSSYALAGHGVRALHYLLKPAPQKELFRCMDLVLERCSDFHYTYQYHNQTIHLPINDIIYMTSRNHKIEIITTSESYYQHTSIRNLIGRLPKQFQQCHRTTIINMHHLLNLVNRDAHLTNGHVVPISCTYLEHIRKELTRHWIF